MVNQLAEKIESDPARPNLILTEPWVGYRFQTRENRNQPEPTGRGVAH